MLNLSKNNSSKYNAFSTNRYNFYLPPTNNYLPTSGEFKAGREQLWKRISLLPTSPSPLLPGCRARLWRGS